MNVQGETPNVEKKDEKNNDSAKEENLKEDLFVKKVESTVKDTSVEEKKENSKEEKKTESMDKKNVETMEKKNVETMEKKNAETTEKKNVETTEKKNVETKAESMEDKGGDDVMNMLLTYLQKNKDDPKIMQTVLSMMNGQGKEDVGLGQIQQVANMMKGSAGGDKGTSAQGTTATDEKKKGREEDEEEGEKNKNDNKAKEEREKENKIRNIFSRKSEKSNFSNFSLSSEMKSTENSEKKNSSTITNHFGDTKKNIFSGFSEKEKSNSGSSNGKFGFMGFGGFGGFGKGKMNGDNKTNAGEMGNIDESSSSIGKVTNSNTNNTQTESAENNKDDGAKKKHAELVDDNDDYIIENADTKEPLEEEAISLIENMDILNNDKKKEKKLNNFDFSKAINSSSNTTETVDFKLYHSKNTWEELNIDNDLIQILTYLKFFGPSKIQAFALPIILSSNKNLIAQAQNGSGKTLTFVIAMLSKINRSVGSLQAMCICPTRELSQQNYEVVGKFTKYLTVKVFLAVPLCEKYNKSNGFQIYVGTPGKTLDFLKRRFIDTNDIKIFVLDEADDLIDIKNNMSSQVESIKRFLPKKCQILLFSATYNNEVRLFADQFAPNATKISVKQEDLTLKCVKQYYLITENEEQKYYYLSELYCSMTISQCVIFVNSKKSAYNLYQFMTNNNHNVTLICADSVISRFTKNQVQRANVLGMDPKTRDTLMSDFKNGISKVLICTDLLSRGIDVPTISLVINFDLPYSYQGRIEESAVNNFSNRKVNMETYIHRIGRTGRFGTKGMAINFISKNQMIHIKQIEKFYKCVISDLEFDSELMITSLSKINS
ncbi:ATP-dependent RNA helicase DBP5 [Plasmodium gonderi]|uniref:RNA helicase n=1 Tax=Plasmodium gonderi TaxID=77519 RepID=A0A1Y1JJ30_PLAGO|nr:ATP-dependent RNA helicase DBP5 [Plasmodium gonderi]GAW82496.1 ATP-dependent RNA helicase DBP5 [Plasmodium gonderi]